MKDAEMKKEENEENDPYINADAIVMPGSPSDPSLEEQREKKNSIHSSRNASIDFS